MQTGPVHRFPPPVRNCRPEQERLLRLVQEMPAGVTVYAMYQESETVAMHFGTWFAPLNTAEDAVGMVSMIGNADGTLTVGSFGVNFADSATPRSATSGYYGVPVSDIR